MGQFLRDNWFWIALLVFFFWMHGSGRGCGGHGRRGGQGPAGCGRGGQERKGEPAGGPDSPPAGRRLSTGPSLRAG